MKLNKKQPLYQEDLQYILQTKDINQLKGKSFLITGATGMVGVMLIDALMALGDVKVYAVGRSEEKARLRLGEYFGDPNFSFLCHDVTKPYPDGLEVDYIIPAASNTHPLAYSKYPIETIMVNVKGAEQALELAVRTGAIVIYPSSNEIYGSCIDGKDFTEDSNGYLNLSNARSCYNESKRVSEAMCQSYAEERGVKVKIARLCRIFGPTMLEEDTKASSQFIKNALREEDIVLKSEGLQYFSYTYVADAVAGLLHVLLHGELQSVYNVSSEKTNVTLRDFARCCAACCGKKVIFDLPSEEERKGYSLATRAILDNSRIRTIGFNPKYDVKDSIERTIEILKG